MTLFMGQALVICKRVSVQKNMKDFCVLSEKPSSFIMYLNNKTGDG